MIAESFVRAPASTFAAPLTTTAVKGIAPKSPQVIFPIPCAISSRLTGVMRLRLSNLSTASMQSSVSKVASSPIISPSFQISDVENSLVKSGKLCLQKYWKEYLLIALV